MREFFAANLVFVYLIYGFAFLSMGLVLSVLVRTPLRLPVLDPLWLLAGFGLLHGLLEWVDMATLIKQQTGDPSSAAVLQYVSLLLIGVSYGFLLQFGVGLLARLAPRLRPLRVLPLVTFFAWAALGLIAGPLVGPVGCPAWVASGQAVGRYLLGFPGGLLTAVGLACAALGWRGPRPSQVRHYLLGCGMAFAVYAFLAGLVVSPAPFFPASVLNTDTFLATVGIPSQLGRAAAALAVGALVAEIFIVQAAYVREETNRRLSDALERLQEQERLREEFVSVVAHDLRGPITVIGGFAELLERLPPERHGGDREQKALANIRASANRLQRMVSDLLDASRLEARQLELRRETVDLPRLVEDVVQRTEELTKGHEVQVMVGAAVPPVWADPGRVEQILTNLLSNAAKYSFPETPIVVTLAPQPAERPVETLVSIANRGPGILPEEIPRLFSRFYRPAAMRAAGVPGLGLGLYISKGLIEAHGGHVWVESEHGGVTAFYFTLPMASDRM